MAKLQGRGGTCPIAGDAVYFLKAVTIHQVSYLLPLSLRALFCQVTHIRPKLRPRFNLQAQISRVA